MYIPRIHAISGKQRTLSEGVAKNAHGDVIYTQNNLTITKHYVYDPFGNEINPDETDTNPFRYCGEYFDTYSNTYYLRNRYYYPRLGRFTTMDTYWNVDNMIYGDEQKAVKYAIDGNERIYYDKDGKVIKTELYNSINVLEDKLNSEQGAIQLHDIRRIPDINAILQSSNLYAYGVNNPVKYVDNSGNVVTVVIGGGGAGLILNGNAQVMYVADDKGNCAVLVGASAGYGVGVSVSGTVMVFPDMDKVDTFVKSNTVSIGIKINGKGGGVCIAMYEDKEYTGAYASYGTGASVEIETEIAGATYVLYKNY